MKLLIDTHVALWWFENPMRLSHEAQTAIGDMKNSVYLSTATAWEIAIKRGLGRLQAPGDLHTAMHDNFMEPLPVTIADALRVERLPMHHRDPFDRMLVAQALERGLILVSRDAEIAKYAVPIMSA